MAFLIIAVYGDEQVQTPDQAEQLAAQFRAGLDPTPGNLIATAGVAADRVLQVFTDIDQAAVREQRG